MPIVYKSRREIELMRRAGQVACQILAKMREAAVAAWLHINPMGAQFLGGTGLLIVVSVALDMVQRTEANLVIAHYGGFLSAPGQKGKRIKGRQY